MMEHTTDRLFWTVTSIIVGALILTIGINAFPKATQGVIQPISGVIKQADKVGSTANDSGNKAANDASRFTLQDPSDPYANDRASVVEASTLGITATDNGDGTATITHYDSSYGTDWNIPTYVKVNNKLLKVTVLGAQNAYGNITNKAWGITSVTIPGTVTTINTRAFAYNPIKNITIPNSVTTIASKAFSANNLSNITLPSSVTNLASDAFDSNATITRN